MTGAAVWAQAPTITVQPQSQPVAGGANVTFTVVATGAAPLNYQWAKNGTALANGTAVALATISGAQTATLTLTGVQAGDVGRYSAFVGNATGSITSAPAVLTVGSAGLAPMFYGMTRSQTTLVGQNVTFAASVSGSPAMTYQWKKDGTNIALATSASLSLTAVQLTDAGAYTMEVTNGFGSASSATMQLTVANTAPVNDSFASATLLSGTTASVGGTNIGASAEVGEPDHSGYIEPGIDHGGHSVWWQWTAPQNGAFAVELTPPTGSVLDPMLGVYTGSAANALTPIWRGLGRRVSFFAVSGVTYRIVVDGFFGSTGTFTLGLATANGEAPGISHPLMSQGVMTGRDAVLNVMTTGTAPLTFQWKKGTATVVDGGNISGASTSMLRISAAQPASAGDYTVIITNDLGTITSDVVTLRVGDPVISFLPQARTAAVGENIMLNVYALGTPPLSYRWRKGTTDLSDGGNIAGAATDFLILTNVQLADAGTYSVVVTSGASGTATSGPVALTVNAATAPPVITSPTTATATVGTAFNFQVTASNSPTAFAAAGLPAGLSLNAASGTISGTPTTAGTYAVSLGASNSVGGSPLATLTITVNAAVSVPANDNFANAQVVTGTSGTTAGNNAGATGESGEPTHLNSSGTGSSVWYKWTAAQTGSVVFDTIGSGFDTVMAAYTGSTLASLTKLAEDDEGGVVGNTSKVSFNVSAATDYYIAVGSWGGTRGNISLNWVASTTQLPVPAITSPATATATVGFGFSYTITASNSPTTFAAANLPAGLSLTVANGLISGTPTAAGTFAVTLTAGGAGGTSPGFTLTITVNAAPTPPSNDNFGAAQVITGNSGTVTGTNLGATGETGEPHHLSSASRGADSSVWYRWAPAQSGSATINTDNSGFDTVMAVYTGSAVDGLTRLVDDDDSGSADHTSKVTVNVSSGTTYYIAVASYNPSNRGAVTLNWQLGAAAVPTITSATTAIGTAGTAFTYTITASESPTAFAATNLPAGLSLNTTSGVISGTPTTAGSYQVSLTATNAGGTSPAVILALTVVAGTGAAPTISLTSPVEGSTFVAGSAVNVTAAATDADGTVTAVAFFANSTSIGVDASAPYGVAWTPASAGSFSLTARATDDSGNTTTSAAVSVTVTAPPPVPAITSGLTASATVGTTFSFQVTASNSPTAFAATNLPPGLTIATATGMISGTPTTAGPYAVALAAANAGGTGPTVTLTITVSAAPGAPTITVQPLSQMVTIGASVTFAVAATGTGPLSYQWRLGPSAVVDGGNIAGAATSTLTITGAQPENAGIYTCVVTNAAGSTISNGAQLTISSGGIPPIVTSPVRHQTAVVGGTVTFAISVGGTPPFTYQWKKAGNNIANATNATLTLSNVQMSDVGSYAVQITGTSVVTSPQMALSVTTVAPANDSFASAATLTGTTTSATGYSVGATLEPGEPDHIGHSEAGPNHGGASVWWKWIAGVAPGAVAVDTSGSTFNNLLAVYTGSSLGGLSLVGANGDNGSSTTSALSFAATAGTTYYIAVDGLYGATGSIQLNLAPTTAAAPSFTAQPNGMTAPAGGNVGLSAKVAGTAPFTYVWKKDGVDVPGGTTNPLILRNVPTSAAGSYTLTVTNAVSSATSNAAVLTISGEAGPPSIQVQPQSQAVPAGGNALLGVWAVGTPPLSYQWKKGGVALANGTAAGGATIAGAQTPTLSLTSVQPGDAGSYTCTIANSLNTVTSATAVLTVPSPATVEGYGLVKIQRMVQSSASGVAPVSGAPFAFEVRVLGQSLAGLAAPSFTTPGGSGVTGATLMYDSNKGRWGYSSSATYASLSALAVDYNDGTYPLTINAVPVNLTLSGSTPLPASPQISGGIWSNGALQVVAGNDYTLTFSPFSDRVGNNLVELHVTLAGVAVFRSATFDGSTVSFVIPAGTLTAGNTYQANLEFSNLSTVDTTTIPGANGVAGVASRVGFNLAATAAVTVPTITSGSTAAATAGAAFNFQVTASNSPTSFAATNLPPGLTIGSANGVISGTPTAVGSYAVSLTATNAGGTSPAFTVTITVNAAVAAPVITSGASATATVGTAFTYTVTASNSPTSFVATNLPPGLSIAAATGVISGTPTAAGSYAVSLTASNAGGTSPAVTLTITVGAAAVAPTITTQPVKQQAAEGGAVTLTVTAAGTAPLNYQWKKGAATLTDGGRVSGATTATLTISGAVPADSGSYSVVVTNSVDSVTSAEVVVGVVPAGTGATHAVVGIGYNAGGTVTIANMVIYTGAATGLTWHVLLPEGWSYVSSAGAAGATAPTAGATNLLDWNWTTVPTSPVTFSYTLNVPAGTSGGKALASLATLTQNGVGLGLLAQPDPLAVSVMIAHSADTDKNSRISLVELTRVIELYNTRLGTLRTGRYLVQAGTEDGFAPDSVSATNQTLSVYHSADCSLQDGRLTLTELTRVIELYNYRDGTVRTGQYHVQTGTEDGFGPGP